MFRLSWHFGYFLIFWVWYYITINESWEHTDFIDEMDYACDFHIFMNLTYGNTDITTVLSKPWLVWNITSKSKARISKFFDYWDAKFENHFNMILTIDYFPNHFYKSSIVSSQYPCMYWEEEGSFDFHINSNCDFRCRKQYFIISQLDLLLLMWMQRYLLKCLRAKGSRSHFLQLVTLFKSST